MSEVEVFNLTNRWYGDFVSLVSQDTEKKNHDSQNLKEIRTVPTVLATTKGLSNKKVRTCHMLTNVFLLQVRHSI